MKMIIRIFILLFMALNVNMAFAGENISSVGAGKDYETLTLWEADKNGDIRAGNSEVAEVYGTIWDNVVIDGWLTDSDSKIIIRSTSTDRHNGTIATGAKIISGDFGTLVIGCNESNVEISYLIIQGTTTQSYPLISCYSADSEGDETIIHNNILCEVTGSSAIRRTLTGYLKLGIYNNIIYNIAGDPGKGIDIQSGTTNATWAYNNTLSDCVVGIAVADTYTCTIENNLCNGNTTDYSGSFISDGHNISEDATSPDVAYRSHTVTFDNEGGDDFTINNGDGDNTLKDGTDLSGDGDFPFSIDVEKVTRVDWYCGASEYIDSGGDADDGSRNYFYAK